MKQSPEAVVKRAYHHGDLENALVQAAIGIIRQKGVDALSIREVGQAAGVSRNALYRHFDGKNALLAEVAVRGFRTLHRKLNQASEDARRRGVNALEEMAAAYVSFALSNPSHYEAMFGAILPDRPRSPELSAAGAATYQALVDAIAAQQQAGRMPDGDTMRLAQVIWAEVHGIATLGIHGRLSLKRVKRGELSELARFAVRCLAPGIEDRQPPASKG